MASPYDYRNCQSLFGYAASVHERSGAICQLCGCGSHSLDFDLWRQLTVEHLIGFSQGGYLSQIIGSLSNKYPGEESQRIASLAAEIDLANTITACSFCNSTTSRDRAPQSMEALIEGGPDNIGEIATYIAPLLREILERKSNTVRLKLTAVRAAYDELLIGKLEATRKDGMRPVA